WDGADFLHGGILGRDFSWGHHVDRPRAVARRPGDRDDVLAGHVSGRVATGDAANDAALRQSVRSAAEEHLAAIDHRGAGPDVYRAGVRVRYVPAPGDIHHAGHHLPHHPVSDAEARENAGAAR